MNSTTSAWLGVEIKNKFALVAKNLLCRSKELCDIGNPYRSLTAAHLNRGQLWDCLFSLMNSNYLRGCDIVPNIPLRQNRLEIIQWQLDICNEQPACAALFSVLYQKCLAKLNNREFTPLRVTYEYLTACMMKQHSMYAVRKAMKWLLTIGLIQDCRKVQTRFLKNAKPDNAHFVVMDWVRLCELLQVHGYELPTMFKTQSKEELKAHLLKTTSGLFGTPKPIREEYSTKSGEETVKSSKVKVKPAKPRSVESNRPIRNMTKESEDSLVKETPNPLPVKARARGNVLSRRRSDTIDLSADIVETNNLNLSLMLGNEDLCNLLAISGINNIQSVEARRLLTFWGEGKLSTRHLTFMRQHSSPPQFESANALIEYCKQIDTPDEQGLSDLSVYLQQMAFEQDEICTPDLVTVS